MPDYRIDPVFSHHSPTGRNDHNLMSRSCDSPFSEESKVRPVDFSCKMFNISRSSQHSNSYMSSHSKKSSYYVTPLHKLDKLTQSYKSKKDIENDNYKQLYRTGECIPFQQPSSYHCHYTHHRTSIEILDKLIDGAHQTTHYTTDTKSTPSITSTIATCTHMYVI
ncbi:unnamed protein product [Didymodactylos carnosus]|uniref:Uncharacterized protein n=1 Tax=Didymodactylos carnosus TaxID=1234261 RepID=A0A816CYN1_9BILA|nr:unnamed protein product [Didymodactylos carnosus]CAF4527970.1 unnamed protein product [Didymodactylos carnosus]